MYNLWISAQVVPQGAPGNSQSPNSQTPGSLPFFVGLGGSTKLLPGSRRQGCQTPKLPEVCHFLWYDHDGYDRTGRALILHHGAVAEIRQKYLARGLDKRLKQVI